MVNEDYGKRAYIKLNSLEKRLEKLETFALEANYSELLFNLNGADTNVHFYKSFKIEALKEGTFTFIVNLKTSLTMGLWNKITVNVNGIQASRKTIYVNSTSYSFDVPLNKGVNEISCTVEANDTFSLEELTFKVNGNVSYVKTTNRLSHVLFNNTDYIVHLKDKVATLYSYHLNEFNVLLSLNGLKECSILGVDNGFLYILSLYETNVLKIVKFEIDALTTSEEVLNVRGVTSACGFYNGVGFTVIFSKLTEIFTGNYLFNSDFTYTATGLRGVKVYACPDAPNSYVIIDKYSNAKLVI